VPIDLLAITTRHFLPGFNAQLDRINDPRCQTMITYTVRHLIWEEILMLAGGSQSRHQMDADTRRPGFLETLLDLTRTDEEAAAHPATVLWLLAKLAPGELVGFQAALVRRLFRMRCLERFRFGIEWLVAIDGTWLRVYHQKHCDKCLYQTQPDGSKLWFHAVLEAKLILSNGMGFSLASVPIENPGGEYDKQDCELKALPRLAEKLKALYPRLPICIVADSLYGCAPTMQLCETMRWSYIVTFKQGRTPALWKRALQAVCEPEQVVIRKDRTVQRFRWATNLNHEGHTVHAIICEETKPDGETGLWAWLTDHRPDRTNVAVIANQGGRLREKIEQQFNVQKNGELKLKHDYGSNATAWYNTYLVAQITHMLLQLIQHSDIVRRLSAGVCDTFATAFRTLRNFAIRLHESIQRDRLGPTCRGPGPRSIQIRFFDTS
jgi:hypothetical protein